MSATQTSGCAAASNTGVDVTDQVTSDGHCNVTSDASDAAFYDDVTDQLTTDVASNIISDATDAGFYDEWCWECYHGYWEYRSYLMIMTYIPPVMILLGTMCNVLNLVVLRSKHYRCSPSSITLTALAVADIAVLNIGLLRLWILNVWEVDIRMYHVIGCKIHVYLTYTTIPLSGILLAISTLERAVSVCFPIRSKDWVTKSRMTGVVLSAVILLFTLHLPIPVTAFIQDLHGLRYCNFPSYPLPSLNWEWFDFVVSMIIPFTIVALCNIIIVCKLAKASRKRTNMGISKQISNYSITIMLLTVGVVFILTLTPVNLFFLGEKYGWVPVLSELDWARYDLTYAVTVLLMYMNNVLNFVLYCLAGRKFRKATVDVLGLHRKVLNTTTSINSTVISNITDTFTSGNN